MAKDFITTINEEFVNYSHSDEDEDIELNQGDEFHFNFNDSGPIGSFSRVWDFSSAKRKLIKNDFKGTSVDDKIKTRREKHKQQEVDANKGNSTADSRNKREDNVIANDEDESDGEKNNENVGQRDDSARESANFNESATTPSESSEDDNFSEDEAVDKFDTSLPANNKTSNKDVTTDIVNDNTETRVIQRKPRKERKEYFVERLLEPSHLAESFDELNLSRPLLKAISELGYHQPTPIQQQTLPVALNGRDVCASAITGSGKTAAFVLPILERLLYRDQRVPSTRVLILVPTRELAVQCNAVIESLSKYTNQIRTCLVTGGMSMAAQQAELRTFPDIIVATPGRLIDHLRNTQSFGLEGIEILVLDEADRLLEMGFIEEVEEIVKMCPKSRQTMLFSATMTEQVDKLIKLSLHEPVRISVDPMGQLARKLVQEFIRIKPNHEDDRPAYLLALCTRTFKKKVLIFFQHKQTCHKMKIVFGLAGLNATELHGDLTQAKRLEALENFRDGKTDFLLATDVAARGLDIIGIETVINYQMPPKLSGYIHRVGRTARAGSSGRSVSFIGANDRKLLKEILKKSGTAEAKQRIIPSEAIAYWKEKIENMAQDITEILNEEQKDKKIQETERELTRVQNLIEHEEEIFSRPKKTWFITEKEKQILREKSKQEALNTADEANNLEVSEKNKRGRKRKNSKHEDDPTAKKERKLKKRRKIERDPTMAKVQEIAARQIKKANKQKKVSQLRPEDLLTPGAKRVLNKKKEKNEKNKKHKQNMQHNGSNFAQEIKRAQYKKEPAIRLGKKKPTSKFKSKKRYKRR
jgi:ATP-dependent RNA helicase DDX27